MDNALFEALIAQNLKSFYNMQWDTFMLSKCMKQGGEGPSS
jgi:hypothetical protein